METMNERYEKILALQREDSAKFREDLAKRDVEASKRDVEASKRELRIILTIIGLFVAGISVQLYLGS